MSGQSRQLLKSGWTRDIVVSYPVPLGRRAIRGKNLGIHRSREKQKNGEDSED